MSWAIMWRCPARVPVECTGADVPALFHALPGALKRRLLFRRQCTARGYRRQASHGCAVAGDDEFLAGFHLADAAGEALIGFAEGERLGHTAYA